MKLFKDENKNFIATLAVGIIIGSVLAKFVLV